MASYTVNRAAVRHARELIRAKRYVLDSDWGDVQPNADDENAYLEKHSWKEYGAWHLGLTEGATDETKARHGFVFGDFSRIHRTGSSPASTGPASGGTSRSSGPRTGCSRSSTRPPGSSDPST